MQDLINMLEAAGTAVMGAIVVFILLIVAVSTVDRHRGRVPPRR